MRLSSNTFHGTWFSSIENVAEALAAASLSAVFTETRYYTVRIPTREYLLSRDASVQGLVLRRALSPAQWNNFTTRVAEAFQTKFGDIVEYPRARKQLWEGNFSDGSGASCGMPEVSSSNYDVTPDGQRFLMVRDDDRVGANGIVVVRNWAEELKTKARTHSSEK